MIFTKELFEKGKSSNGGWNNRQLAAIGIEGIKKRRGWPAQIIGKDLPREAIELFLSLKDAHFNPEKLERLQIKKTGRGAKLNFEPCVKIMSWSDQYLHPNWQKMRLYIFRRDQFRCVDCRATDKPLHAHHLKYIAGKYVWEVPHFYIVTLCEDCHSKEHGRDLKAKRVM